jgi:hypothetical protein
MNSDLQVAAHESAYSDLDSYYGSIDRYTFEPGQSNHRGANRAAFVPDISYANTLTSSFKDHCTHQRKPTT